jgi:hypothetical protein
MKVVNEDRVSVTTKVAVKQFRYMPITPRLKQLYLSEETVKQMRTRKGNVIAKTPILCCILLILKLGRPWIALI